MPDDYLLSLERARDLIQLAGETSEGRSAARAWLRQVAAAVGEDEDPAAAHRAEQVRAAQDLGYDVALSETGAGIELYPDLGSPVVMLSDDSGPAADGGTDMYYTEADLDEARQQDEIDRLGLMVQSRRPARPQYAGLRLSEPRPQDEVDAQDIVRAEMDLASRIPGATFRDVAEAVDEIALSGSTEDRADALMSLARRYAPATPSPAAGALDLELARQREIARAQGAEPDEAEVNKEEVARIVAAHQDMLTDKPRPGRTTLTSDSDYDKYSDASDCRQPSRGGVMHPEIERLAREHGLYFGPPAGNASYPLKSPQRREAEERRARPGHQPGMFSIPDLDARRRRGQQSAFGSRG
jgi:hypothetical protein